MSTIERAEQLKRELTDRWVLVQEGVPELRRFSGLTGKVKTVNMNCRALVQFDGAVDISWYDIDPAFLKVVDAPLPKKPVEEKKAPAEKPAAAAKPAAAKTGGKSPLELAREQAAAAKAAPAKPAGLSPLEMARQQGAAGTKPAPAAPATETPAEEPAAVETPAPAPAPKPAPPADGKKLSPLELARQQGAAKRD